MNQKIFSYTIILFTIIGTLFTTHQRSHASTRYFDDKLVINGFVKETANIRTAMHDRDKDYHDSALDFLQTSALLELLYTVKDEEDFGVKLFIGFKYWWQKAQYFDQEMRRTIPHHQRKHWTHPQSFKDDILTEAYIDINTGPWKIRVGKQIVIWGQLDLERVADVVNPIDIRRGPPGVNTFRILKHPMKALQWVRQHGYHAFLSLETNQKWECIPGKEKNGRVMHQAGI